MFAGHISLILIEAHSVQLSLLLPKVDRIDDVLELDHGHELANVPLGKEGFKLDQQQKS